MINKTLRRASREIVLTTRSISTGLFITAKKMLHKTALWVADKTT